MIEAEQTSNRNLGHLSVTVQFFRTQPVLPVGGEWFLNFNISFFQILFCALSFEY